MPAVTILPAAPTDKAWSAILPPRTPRPPLARDTETDWAVLGAGFTGLAAARRLAELRPQERIVVLDAGVVGENASGRNSGFAIDHAHALGGGASRDAERAQSRLYAAGLDELRRLVAAHAIACDWREDGKYHAARTMRSVETVLRPMAAHLDAAGAPHRWLESAALRDVIGVDVYAAAIHTPGSVLVNPAALVRGLADALPANVVLHESTPVLAITDGPTVMLETPQARVSASGLIVATNAFTPAVGYFRSALLPLVAFASLTRPLTPQERAALGGRPSWGVTPADAFVSPTIQRTGDHRVLFRDGMRYRPGLRYSEDELALMRQRHRLRLQQWFPMLGEDAIAHTWGGFLCVSANGHSGFGRVGRKIWAAAGHQGVGITRGAIAGAIAAELALGNEHPLLADMLAIASPARQPPRPLLDVGVRLRMTWSAWRSPDRSGRTEETR